MRIITDATGRQVEIPQVVQSIVCVNVGTLRFTTYMQATDLVIGVEQNEIEPRITKPFSYINNPLFSTLPVMGDNGTTYDEEIIKLNPDVVMAAVDKDTADNLQNKLGIPVVTIPLIDNMFDSKCYQTLALMGEVYGRQERANELIAYIKGLEEDLTRRTKDIPEEEKPTVYAGGISFKGAHGFDGTEANYSPFVAIGAKNLADLTGQTGAFNIDLEQVLQWDPDIIFLDFNGMALINEDYAANPDYYNSLTAIKEGRLYSQISFRTNAVNAELALADAYYAGKVIFPQQFADVDPAAKADEIFEMMLGTKFYDTLKEHGYEFKEMKLGE
ncbi:MAG: iron ABC transporter substrate-binding protein [Oscillospiraceae bacterium]